MLKPMGAGAPERQGVVQFSGKNVDMNMAGKICAVAREIKLATAHSNRAVREGNPW